MKYLSVSLVLKKRLATPLKHKILSSWSCNGHAYSDIKEGDQIQAKFHSGMAMNAANLQHVFDIQKKL